MSAITAFQPASRAQTTRFEHLLLIAAARLDAFVAARLERRATAAGRSAHAARQHHAETRRAAEARGAAGILPR